MKTIFNDKDYQELYTRLEKLTPNQERQWGKMNVSQMLHHINLAMDAPLGKFKPATKPFFLMRIFKSVLYNAKPFGKGEPTPKDFKIAGDYDFNNEKANALDNMKAIAAKGINGSFQPHAFFGKLTNEQWGLHFYKHIDHHLRQFGV